MPIRELPILMYHNVGPLPVQDPFELTVAPDQFERQMCWLASSGYETIWPSDWIATRRGEKPLPSKPVLLTFDDGYAEMAEYAFPILDRLDLKAAVYVVTKRIGLTNTWDEVNGHPTMRLMSADQIRRWARQRIEFGSHTRTHPRLTALNKDRLSDEIGGSREDLEAMLGAEVRSFAYPYGDGAESSNVREHVSRTYHTAMTVIAGRNAIEANPFELRRVRIQPSDSLADFERKLKFNQTMFSDVRRLVPRHIRTAARTGRRALRERLGY